MSPRQTSRRKSQVPRDTLLESGAFPYSDIIRFAAREGRRPRPIYQLHKWFARRLGSTVRALLVGATNEPSADFWAAYYGGADLSDLAVLDPFVGGGTSVVEAARLGASAIGVDVDPIACAVTEAELTIDTLPDLIPTLVELQARVGARLSPFYKTRSPTGLPLTALHYFWVQVVRCEECRTPHEAHPNFLLSHQPTDRPWVFCRSCHHVHQLRRGQHRFRCCQCDATTDLTRPPLTAGILSCDRCLHQTPLIDAARSSTTPPRWRLFAVEAAASGSGRVPMSQRVFHSASAFDLTTLNRARKTFDALRSANKIHLPIARIEHSKRSDSRLAAYGYHHWVDLFNERQLLHLGLLAAELNSLPERLKGPLGLAFSNHLTTNCMMTAYASGWRRLTPLFSIRAFRHVPRPVELNPWTDGVARGSYPNAVRQVQRAANFARAPREPDRRRGRFLDVPPIRPAVAPKVVRGNAKRLAFIASDSIDLILTDPPYFDNVAYSELADFFQPWLERLGLVPSAGARRSLVRGALQPPSRRDTDGRSFAKELGDAFKEAARVLKPDGLLAFTFRHSTVRGWHAMAYALGASGLRPVAVLPFPGEPGVGLHIHDSTALWDTVLVLRKRPAQPFSDLLSTPVIRVAQARAASWRQRFRRQHRVRFNHSDYVNLFRAFLVAASVGLFGKPAASGKRLRAALESAG
jgi:putative DNA methylase